jgi:hypothetical protein
MLLADLGNDLWWEVRGLCNLLSLGKEAFFQKSLNLYIILHFIELEELFLGSRPFSPWNFNQEINRIFFNFY